MKRIFAILIMVIFSFQSEAQQEMKNSLSTSMIRFEKSSPTIHHKFNFKFVTALEYRRFINKWNVGIKYEHGFNKIDENSNSCYDCYYGIGYLREDNIFLTANYSILSLLDSKLKLNTGLGIYYSNMNYSGDFQGGLSGGGMRKNSTYNSFGVSPNLEIIYSPSPRLFIGINTSFRYGWSERLKVELNKKSKMNEFGIIAPELRIGVNF